MHNPKDLHLRALNRILTIIKKGTRKRNFIQEQKELSPEVYTNADSAESMVDRRSTSGCRTFLGRNLVTWRSKKQNGIVRSNAEAEFRAMALRICELLWLKIILKDLQLKWEAPIRLYCENKSPINMHTTRCNMAMRITLMWIGISSRKS